jgi:hemolysin III
MQRVDHAMIYVKIAGSMTPIVWAGLDDWRRATILAGAWGVAGLGIAQKALLPRVHPKACVPVQIFQAALVIPALGPFVARFPGTPALLVAFIAGIYAIGVLIFLTERPRLWPSVFSHHELFHVTTLLGSGAHYLLALHWLARL